MTQTDKGTDRSTNRDASHLKQTLDYHGHKLSQAVSN